MSLGIFLDPSSSRIGYAVMSGPRPQDLLDAGFLKPAQRGADILIRLKNFGGELIEVLAEYPRAEFIAVEIPSGMVWQSRHGGGGTGLALYGMGVGYVLAVCHEFVTRQVVATGGESRPTVLGILDRVWTQRKKKSVRLQRVRRMFPQYRELAERDTGGDAGDAIAMGHWWHTIGAARTLRDIAAEAVRAENPRRTARRRRTRSRSPRVNRLE